MQINLRSPKATNCMAGNRHLSIPFYVIEKKDKLSLSEYQVYKLCTNPNDKKSMVHLLTVEIYDVETQKNCYSLWMQLLRSTIDEASQIRTQPTCW
eukprot:10643530-Ditylum_brightwellii.AAC.1